MYRSLSVLTCLLLISLTAPPATAGHVQTQCYVAAGGGSHEAYAGFIEDDVINDVERTVFGTDEGCGYGGVHFDMPLLSQTTFALAQAFDHNSRPTAIQLCVAEKTTTYGPPAQSYCQAPTSYGAIIQSSFTFDEVSVFVFQFYVEHDLDVALGTQGQVLLLTDS